MMMIAYIDAGTGAMLLQGIIALVIGTSFFFRNAVGRVFRVLFGRKSDKADAVKTDKQTEDKK